MTSTLYAFAPSPLLRSPVRYIPLQMRSDIEARSGERGPAGLTSSKRSSVGSGRSTANFSLLRRIRDVTVGKHTPSCRHRSLRHGLASLLLLFAPPVLFPRSALMLLEN